MSDDPWGGADLVVEIDERTRKSWSAGVAGEDQRRRPRRQFACRATAALDGRAGQTLGVYCRDLSQTGVGLLAPSHALPLEQGRLQLKDQRELAFRVRHCRRLSAGCFLWGCDFDAEPDGGPLRGFGDALAACGATSV